MKVMLNTTCFHGDNSTGIERFAYNIAREICNLDPMSMVLSSGRIPGVQCQMRSGYLTFFNQVLGKYEYPARAIWDQTWLRFLVERHKPDVLFFPIQDGLLYPSVKQIITIHDLHYLHFKQSLPDCRHEIGSIRTRLYQYRMPLLLKQASAIVAVSETTKEEIITAFNVDPEKIHVIYNGYDENRFHVVEDVRPLLNHYRLQPEKYFLFVGSILKHKNLIRLVKAFANLHTEYSLVIAGVCKDKDYLREIMQVAADSGLSDSRLTYLDYVPDDILPALYSGAIALVLPSLHEGFGVPVVEAMACGVPVITSNISAMPEVAGEAAILIDPYSIESMTSAMRSILDNSYRAEILRLAGLERSKVFRWSTSAMKLYELFLKVSNS